MDRMPLAPRSQAARPAPHTPWGAACPEWEEPTGRGRSPGAPGQVNRAHLAFGSQSDCPLGNQ